MNLITEMHFLGIILTSVIVKHILFELCKSKMDIDPDRLKQSIMTFKMKPSIVLKGMIINMCIITPICEELLFRYLPSILFSSSIYFIISVPIFGLYHAPNYFVYRKIFTKNESLKMVILHVVNACVTSALCYMLFERYETIFPSLILHIMENTYVCQQLYN
ncbi:MAG: hypothetical protein Terrestrivirus1_306 [Terrestrivirus sp.]|uniref:CAAX prenyl protease 2/Lysostaphin resistance protein A-like domain-containing protein n=1 Tax=Terrestrivirus sp. TaxID=2487775 RepID=A0A3G4ZKS0_9VIRU|nr:MAG: hypothetical protein Terrestrivirus1_306 [Terrestrivirus sp.]